jgi:signal peptidase I
LKSFENTILDVLGRGMSVRFHATGQSMLPAIRSGEHLHVSPVGGRSLRIGDIVLARSGGRLLAHRIVRMSAQSIITRGDNAYRPDPSFSPSDILGRVTHLERDGATVAVPAAPRRIRLAAARVRNRLFFSLSQLVRSVV